MNAQFRLIKYFLILALFAAVLVPLTGCAPAALADVEVGIEPTPTPNIHSYTNDFYGFAFDYPETWTLSEEDHAVVLTQGRNRLAIHFRWIEEELPPFRTGMAAGTPIYSGKIDFMGQIIPQYTVELEHLAKYVIYGETQPIEIGDLAFTIFLEDLTSDYMLLDMSQDVIAQAASILESFEAIEATGSPEEAPPTPEAPSLDFVPLYPEWSVYENSEYGFAFCYPPEMTLAEEPNRVLVSDGTLQLTIAYGHPDEPVQLSSLVSLEGQFYIINEMPFLGIDIRVFENVFDGIVKNVYFGEPGPEISEGLPLRFVISLTDTSGSELSQSQISQMTEIVQCFGLTSE